MKPRRSIRAIVLLLAAISPLGIATHLAGELGALGLEADVPVAFGAHHLYLALLALASAVTAATIVRGEIVADRALACRQMVAALRWRGEGWKFAGLCVGAQLTIFTITQALEGIPMSAGDVALGLATAAATALLSSLAVVRFKDALVRFAIRLCIACRAIRARSLWSLRVIRPARTARRRWAVLATRASRPPPRRIVAA